MAVKRAKEVLDCVNRSVVWCDGQEVSDSPD